MILLPLFTAISFGAFPVEHYFLVIAVAITLVFMLMLRAVKGTVIETGLLLTFFFTAGSDFFFLILILIQLLLTVLVLFRLKIEIDTYNRRIEEKTHLILRVITKSGKSGEAFSSFDRLLF